MNCGRSINARAMPTRCRWPPESMWGYLGTYSSGGVRRTSRRALSILSLRSSTPWMTMGSSSTWKTLMNGSMLE